MTLILRTAVVAFSRMTRFSLSVFGGILDDLCVT